MLVVQAVPRSLRGWLRHILLFLSMAEWLDVWQLFSVVGVDVLLWAIPELRQSLADGLVRVAVYR